MRTNNIFESTALTSSKSSKAPWKLFENNEFTIEYPHDAVVIVATKEMTSFALPHLPQRATAVWKLHRWSKNKYSLQELIDQVGAETERDNHHERIAEREDIALNGRPALLITVKQTRPPRRKRVIIEMSDSFYTIDDAGDDGLADVVNDFERFYKSIVIK